MIERACPIKPHVPHKATSVERRVLRERAATSLGLDCCMRRIGDHGNLKPLAKFSRTPLQCKSRQKCGIVGTTT